MVQESAETTRSRGNSNGARQQDESLAGHLNELPEWNLVEEDGVHKLRRTFRFSNFAQALAFVNLVGEAAEERSHHPVIMLTWGKATVTWYTHDVGGLHEDDFVMAARSDQLFASG